MLAIPDRLLGDVVLMAITRISVLVCCSILFFVFSLSLAEQVKTPQQVVIDQAVLQKQSDTQEKVIASIQQTLKEQQAQYQMLRDEQAIQKGIGVGVAGLIGLLQSLQMVLQIRQSRKS